MKGILINLVFALFLMILGGEIYLRYASPLHIQTTPGTHFKALAGKDQSYQYLLQNSFISKGKVDPFIKITRNALGLRGEDFNSDQHEFKIFFIGGSTTECITLGDGTTWVDHLKNLSERQDLWLANAGVNGQSSIGHIDFVKRHYLKQNPQGLVFLIGANEINSFYLNENDEVLKNFGKKRNWDFNLIKNPRKLGKESTFSFWGSFHKLKEYSAIFLNLSEWRNREVTKGLPNTYVHSLKLQEIEALSQTNYEFEVDLKTLEKSSSDHQRIQKELEQQSLLRKKVRENILELIKISRQKGITPLFITQPALYGPAIDPTTGTDLGTMVLQSGNVKVGQGLTGNEMWKMLESYNDIVREVTKKEAIPLIDLAKEMPKDSRYYYDYIHFSKEGAKKVAQLIAPELNSYFHRYIPK